MSDDTAAAPAPDHNRRGGAEPNEGRADPTDEYVISDSDAPPTAACIRCGRTFADSDDYHRVTEYGPNSLLYIHTEDC